MAQDTFSLYLIAVSLFTVITSTQAGMSTVLKSDVRVAQLHLLIVTFLYLNQHIFSCTYVCEVWRCRLFVAATNQRLQLILYCLAEAGWVFGFSIKRSVVVIVTSHMQSE